MKTLQDEAGSESLQEHVRKASGCDVRLRSVGVSHAATRHLPSGELSHRKAQP